MHQLCRIGLVACLFAGALAAQAAAQPTASPASPAPPAAAGSRPDLWPATFEGITPCADCPGVKVTITLRSDGTYHLKRVYLERKGTFDESGHWAYDRDRERLTLFPSSSAAAEMFSVTFSSQLHMLDAEGNPLPDKMSSTLAEVEPVIATLAGTGWVLTELAGKPFTSSEQHPTTVIFDAVGDRVSGSGGCNRYTGPYKQDGEKLSFGALASTKMMCANIAGEDQFFAMLAKVASFAREGDWLTLYDAHGGALAKLGYQK